MRRTSWREIRVGLIVAVSLAGAMGLVSLAGGGPGFLASQRTIDVVFRDGQGIRPGCPVRIAGLDAGRVSAVDLTTVEGELRARVKLSLPEELAAKLRQDVQVTIQPSLTGQSIVNVVSSGRSAVALVPGQLVQGVESSFFDPVLEQVGLGPVERKHLSHTIAEVRATVDSAGPRLRQILSSLQETAANVRDTAETARPAIEATVGRVEQIAQRVDPAKIEETVNRLNAVTAQLDTMLAENRPVLQSTLKNIDGITTDVHNFTAKDGPKIDAMLDGFETTRNRLDGVLAQAQTLTSQSNDLMLKNRPNIDRTISNVRDASDFGVKLVGKLYGNPFYLSPFYKPTKEDIRAQEVYDAANTFMLGAKELQDSIQMLDSMRKKPVAEMTPREREAYDLLFKRTWEVAGKMDEATRQLAEGLQENTRPRR